MITIELKGNLHSPDLEEDLPADPENCLVPIQVGIGPRGSEGADIVSFEVVTPAWLAATPEVRGGRGYLIVPRFSWEECERMVPLVIARGRADDWESAARSLNAFLEWEFHDYRP